MPTRKKKDVSWEEIGKDIGRKVDKESKPSWKTRTWVFHKHESGGAFYGLGFLGALVYYLTTAPTIWAAIIGIFKAIVWPAFFVYGALKFFGA